MTESPLIHCESNGISAFAMMIYRFCETDDMQSVRFDDMHAVRRDDLKEDDYGTHRSHGGYHTA